MTPDLPIIPSSKSKKKKIDSSTSIPKWTIFALCFITTLVVPAQIVLGFWFLIQLSSGLSSLGIDTTGGVAWFAHIGGFITGIMLNQVFKNIKII